MSQELVSKRYAVALFQIANEQNTLDQTEEELREINKVFNEGELLTVLSHPNISKAKKKEIVKEAFQGVSETILNTLLLLVDRKRESIIPGVVEYFTELANEVRGVADAKVYSVRALSEDEEKALSEVFAKKIGKQNLRITNIVDSSLVGGVKLRIGNTIFDGSVKGKLERIERQLVSAKS